MRDKCRMLLSIDHMVVYGTGTRLRGLTVDPSDTGYMLLQKRA